MVNAFNSLAPSKSHAIDIHFETFALKLIGITGGWIRGFDKLLPTGFTEVILLPSLPLILTDVS
jgi:hypothetical protein